MHHAIHPAASQTAFVLALGIISALPAQSLDFKSDIQPILEKNCIGCHNPKLRMSGLSLASREHLATGGRRGPALQSSDTPGSLFLKAIRHDGNLRMPPGRKLTEAEIAKLETWVRSGAAWPAESLNTAGVRPNHWSFQAP